MSTPTRTIFLSAVTDEFGSYREAVRADLDLPGLRVEIQETFLSFGDRTLRMLDEYISKCDAVIHLVGRRSGNEKSGGVATKVNVDLILDDHPDLPARLGLDDAFLRSLSYTQWEAWLAVYHGKKLHIAPADPGAPVDTVLSDLKKVTAQEESQRAHLEALRKSGFHPSDKLAFDKPERLSIKLLRSLQKVPPSGGTLISNIPRPLPHFRGRDDSLGEIQRAFDESRQRRSVDCQLVAIWGMGGIGKTRLAVEYCWKFAHLHTALLSISGKSSNDLTDGLAGLCDTLSLPAADTPDRDSRLKAALEWLADSEHHGWCLIINDVDDKDALEAVETRLRSLHHGSVILTGRLREWPDYVTPLHLDLLLREHSVEYLLEKTAGGRIAAASEAEDRADAHRLARELGDLALALIQAASTIPKPPFSFADYLADWETRRDELLDDKTFDPKLAGYPGTLAVTWLTSYRQLPPLPRCLFDALCWLAPYPIPERLISQNWPEEAITSLPEELRNSLPARPQELLMELYNFCLAEQPHHTHRRLFEIHRIVQDVGRRWQGLENRDSMPRQLAMHLVIADFVRSDSFENLTLHILPNLRETEPHALAIANMLEARDDSWISLVRCSEIHRVCADMRWIEGRFEEGLASARKSVELARSALASRDEGFATTTALVSALGSLVWHLKERGDFPEASERAQEALELLTTLPRLELVDLPQLRGHSIALNNVGLIHEAQGKYREAFETFGRSLSICENLVKREPRNLACQRDLFIALSNVGRIREAQGNHTEALEAFTRSQSIVEMFEQRDPDNRAYQRELAIVLNNVGRIREARGECSEALKAFERSQDIFEIFEQREPHNLAHQRELSIALGSVGRIREVQGEYREALEAFTQSQHYIESFVQLDPGNLAYQRELSIALENVGRIQELQEEYDEALKTFMRSQAIAETLVQQEDCNFVRQRELSVALNNVGRILEAQGKINEALEAFNRSRSIVEPLVQRETSNLALQNDLSVALENIGRILEMQGELNEALEAFVRSQTIVETLTQQDPQNSAHKSALCVTLYSVGRLYRLMNDQSSALTTLTKALELADWISANELSSSVPEFASFVIKDEIDLARELHEK